MENSRTIQSQKTRDKIYENSIKLFIKNGFNKVTIKDIATASKVSVGSFYNYFQSKQDILYVNYKIGDKSFENFVSEGVHGNNAKEKIEAYMLYYIDFVLTQPFDFIEILYTPDNTLFLKEGRLMQTLLNPLIEDAKEKSEITRNFTVEEINEYLFMCMRGLVFHWCLHKGSFDLMKYAKEYFPIIIGSL